jgi:hypothetical protein
MRKLLKPLIRRTPLWKTLRPRHIHVYGVGAPKTGTSSVAHLFGAYRSKHEAHPEWTVNLIKRLESEPDNPQTHQVLKKREEKDRLECESAYYLINFVGHLATLYSNAKFICTVREPRSWLRSIIDQCINNPREQLERPWRMLRDLSFGAPPERYDAKEMVLDSYNLHSVDQYLSYWAAHNRKLLDVVPVNRRLFIRTAFLSQAEKQIADFVGVPITRLQTERNHANKAPEKHNLLDEVDSGYLEEKINEHCRRIMERLQRETPISF